MTASTMAVLGLGAMGARMAINLVQAGHRVRVWNRTAHKTTSLVERGAHAAATPREAVQGAEYVISMTRDDQSSRQIWLDPEKGALGELAKQTIVIESSTLSVAWIRELGQLFTQVQIPFLEAPVAGTLPQAEAAQLIFFVGGEVEVISRAEPILHLLGSAIHHSGPVGSAAAIKLAVNTLFSVQLATMAELIGVWQGCGLDAAKAIEILSATPVCSPATKGAAAAMVARQFTPLFPIELVEKDLGYLLQAATQASRSTPITEITRRIFAQAIEQGYGGDNITGVAQLYNP